MQCNYENKHFRFKGSTVFIIHFTKQENNIVQDCIIWESVGSRKVDNRMGYLSNRPMRGWMAYLQHSHNLVVER